VSAPLLVTSSPHLRAKDTTSRIMLDVLVALVPALAAAAWFFGPGVMIPVLVAVAGAVMGEYVTRVWILRRDNRLGDLSAVVTGVLLGMNLPPSIPLPLAFFGGALATGFVKELFGGLGMNFMNPAMGARVFLFLAWPSSMTAFSAPLDAVAGPTPLAILKGHEAVGAVLPNLLTLFVGDRAGCLGETSVLALLVGAAYLVARRVIRLDIPVLYLATVGVLTWVFGGKTALFSGNFVVHLLSGGLILGAFFMATDYATQPVSRLGKAIYGLGLGLVTTVIRLATNYPEGVSFAVILMNCLVPIIDRYTQPRVFGVTKAVGHG
jgi:electron transport complex protein RnfD